MLPEALLLFQCYRRCQFCIYGLLIKGHTTEQCEKVVVKIWEVPKLGWEQQQQQQKKLLALWLHSCLCPRGAAWKLWLQLKDLVGKMHFLKPCLASVLGFGAEYLPRVFSGSTGLRCKGPTNLPRAENLLMLAEQATPVELGPVELCLAWQWWSSQQHKEGSRFSRLFFFLREKPCQSLL